ncbi:MAG TPA: O-antigen ligase family protein [Actinomycetota bacterium]|nr:O-antigen ligase family protein [Actinomycetota bacterium]
MSSWLDRLPAESPGRTARWLWIATIGVAGAGIASWLVGKNMDTFVPGVVAMWCFAIAAALLASVLPMSYAVVSPLFMGIVGWLVDMLPFVLLVGWFAVVVRWLWGLVRERRFPRGGRWTWIPMALVAWTALGAVVVLPGQRKHFVLLFGIQVLASATVLLVSECLGRVEARRACVSALLGFVVVCSVAVLLQWLGVPVEALQDTRVSAPVERAYGIDAFVNSTGMIKYERAADGGAHGLAKRLDALRDRDPSIPEFAAYRAPFKAFGTDLVVRFDGSARAVEPELRKLNINLIYDNVGLAPGNEIPRMRSFPRNALTYAGVCAALIPLAFYLLWNEDRRKRWLGRAALAGCLFGIGFSLARGSWAAFAVGILYIVVDGALSGRRKAQVVAALVAAAIVLTGVFLVKFGEDPLHARAGAEGSTGTRRALYEATVGKVTGVHLLLGYGSEQPRDEEGNAPAGLKYVPEAGTHSTYLNYLFRTGVPGVGMLIALYLLAALHARRAARRLDGDDRLLATLVTMAVVVFAAHGVVLSLYVEPVYTLTICVVIGLAFAGFAQVPGSLLPWKRSPAASR